ncbi:MAG: Maf family protein [Flavobacteriales bacterium]
MKLSKELVLGSQSPRRAQFLKDLGLSFTTLPLDLDETAPAHLSPAETATFISELKAEALLPLLQKGQLGLTSDTEVWQGDRRFGKAADADAAKEMLKDLSGTTHEVHSSMTLINPDNPIPLSSVVSTVMVHFYTIPQWAMDHYIEAYKPFDKAGAYGIQEWIGQAYIKRIEGNYNSVVGLDTAALVHMLEPYFQ